MCGGGCASPRTAPSVASQSPSLSVAEPKMRSRFQVANPAAATAAAIASAAPGTWRRPRPASTWACVDCSPKETRVTPARR